LNDLATETGGFTIAGDWKKAHNIIFKKTAALVYLLIHTGARNTLNQNTVHEIHISAKTIEKMEHKRGESHDM
jgi:hypothetical protein